MTDEDILQVRRLFEVMERLRAPGGCPWDRAQTHQTLLPFLLEETYEAIQAAEEGSPEELAEELGDLLVEVAMHSAIAAEAGAFDIGDVAARATDKMVGRHPHVFSDLEVEEVAQVISNWEELKRREKPGRESALDGIPRALPALALAAAVQRRQSRVLEPDRSDGVPLDPAAAVTGALARLIVGDTPGTDYDDAVGELLFAVVALARQRGVDPESALRRTAGARREASRRDEVESRRDASDRSQVTNTDSEH